MTRREVDRGGSLEGVGIDRIARADVVGHVGDPDQQAPSGAPAPADVRDPLAVDRVVEVARILSIDRDHRDVAQVHPPTQVGGTDLPGQTSRLGKRRIGEFMRDVELADRDLDFHPRIVDLAQDLDDPADRLRMSRRGIHDLAGDHLAMAGTARIPRRDQDVVLDALVLRHDDVDATLVEEAPDQHLVGPLGDLDDGALGASPVIGADLLDQHPVAMHGLLHLARRQEHVGLAIVADQEAEAVAMSLDPAGDEIELGGEQQHPLAIGHELPVALHRGEPPLERLALRRPDREPVDQLGRGQRHAGLAQAGEDRLPAGRRGIPPVTLAIPVAATHREFPSATPWAGVLVDKTG